MLSTRYTLITAKFALHPDGRRGRGGRGGRGRIPSAEKQYSLFITFYCYYFPLHSPFSLFHQEHALLAIEAGKHVLVEKPVACTGKDAEEMVARAKAKGVMFLEGMWTRFFPVVEMARHLIGTGAIGRVVALHADFGTSWSTFDFILKCLNMYSTLPRPGKCLSKKFTPLPQPSSYLPSLLHSHFPPPSSYLPPLLQFVQASTLPIRRHIPIPLSFATVSVAGVSSSWACIPFQWPPSVSAPRCRAR